MKIIKLFGCYVCVVCVAFVNPSLAALDHEVSVAVTQSYDDNITYSASNEKEDFVTALSLGLKGMYEASRHTVDVGARVTQHLYLDYDDFNYFSHNLSASYRGELSEYMRVDLTDTFTHSDEPTSFEDSLGRTSGRYSYSNNTLRFTGTADISEHLQASLGYGNDARFVSESNAGPDSVENSVRGSMIYFLDTVNIFTLFYEYAIRSYDPGGDITRQTLFLNGRHYFKDYFYGDAGVGYDFFDSNGTESNPQYVLALTNEFSETTYVTARFSQRYSAQVYTEDLFDEWRTSVTFGHQLLERLGFSFTGFAGRGEYQIRGERDTFYGVTGELAYALTEKLRATLSYSHRTVDSNRASREYERNLVALGLSMRF
jgi:hypothetical protein